MSLAFLYDTVLFDSPSRVFLQQHAGLVPSGVVTEISITGAAGHLAPLLSATDLSITAPANYLTWTFVYPHTVTADTLALDWSSISMGRLAWSWTARASPLTRG